MFGVEKHILDDLASESAPPGPPFLRDLAAAVKSLKVICAYFSHLP